MPSKVSWAWLIPPFLTALVTRRTRSSILGLARRRACPAGPIRCPVDAVTRRSLVRLLVGAAISHPECPGLETARARFARLMLAVFGVVYAASTPMPVSRINGSAPPGEHRRLLGVELTARGLESFSTADPPIAKAVQLPDWAHSARMAWPPPRTVRPGLLRAGGVRPPLVGRLVAGTRRRPRHAGVTGARGCRAGGQGARKFAACGGGSTRSSG